jgi:hypothetical protein
MVQSYIIENGRVRCCDLHCCYTIEVSLHVFNSVMLNWADAVKSIVLLAWTLLINFTTKLLLLASMVSVKALHFHWVGMNYHLNGYIFLRSITVYFMNWDRSVRTTTSWKAKVQILAGARLFSSSQRPDRFWGPPNLLSNGYRCVIFPGVKRPRREADHSPPSNVEVKNSGAIPPPMCLYGIVLN